MEEIFLQDYANNVAQAQDPYGIAAVQAQPGFENYTPSFENQSITPFGLAPETGKIPDFRQMGKNIATNTKLLNTEKFSNGIFSLPLYPGLNIKNQLNFIKVLN